MIKVINLSKAYGKRKILSDVSFSLEDKTIHFLMGKNGAGKSTLIKCLLDLEPYSGQVEGLSSCCIDKQFAGAIFDDSALYNRLSGIDNVRLFTNQSKSEIHSYGFDCISEDLLKKKVSTYSYGEKKRLWIYIIDILSPKLIVMDEVSNGLDYESLQFLKEKIRTWSKTSCILLTGHHFEFYETLIDTCLLLSDQKVRTLSKKSLHLEEIYEKSLDSLSL